VDLARIAQVMGGRVVLVGNVDPLPICQDGANIPPGTPTEHINAVMEAAETWGRYR
jgi:uroporphyrinogen-III decarboxylase